MLELQTILRKYNLESNVAEMGQHFIIDEQVLQRMVYLGDVREYESILEVGAGYGNLTRRIAERRPQMVYAMEKDERFAHALREELAPYDNVRILVCDALETEWPKAEKLIANPPYRISEPLIHRIFTHQFSSAILIFPRFLADRLTANPHDSDYTKLSLMMNSMYDIKIEDTLLPQVFFPRPRVYSALVRLTLRNLVDFETYLVRSMFLQSDKKLKNTLREALIQYGGDTNKRLTKRESRKLVAELTLDQSILEMYIPQIPLEELQRIIRASENIHF